MHRQVILIGKWKAFRQHAEFMYIDPSMGRNEEEKCYLMLWVGEKGRKVFSTWNMTDTERQVQQNHYDRFQAYIPPKSNPILAGYKLHSKVREPNKTCQQFVTSWTLLVKD